MAKTYKRATYKGETYYKCLICYATSESEAYIKGKLCHQPIVKSSVNIASVEVEEPVVIEPPKITKVLVDEKRPCAFPECPNIGRVQKTNTLGRKIRAKWCKAHSSKGPKFQERLEYEKKTAIQ